MKILLNLLPAEKKADRRKDVRFRLIVLHGTTILFLLVLYCCILFGVSMALSKRIDAARASMDNDTEASKRNEIESYEKVFTETNTKISEIMTIADKHVMWKKFFQSIESATPDGIFYTKFLTKNDFSFSVVGVAPNRESLLILEKNMNDADCFRDVVIPLANKLEKENINFQLNAIIEISCVVNPDKAP